MVEEKADGQLCNVDQRRSSRNPCNATEDDREVEISKKRHFILLPECPLDDWGNSTGHEKEDEDVVQLTMREDTLWSNNTPLYENINRLHKTATMIVSYNDRRSTKHMGDRAGEVVFLIKAAKIIDMREHPLLYTKLHHATNESTDDLAKEHRPRWYLHVVTEFKNHGR
jgi:hypothetical protein